MKHQYQSFTRIGRQFQSLKRQVYAVWTSVSFPLCQRCCLIWRIMTNTMRNTYVVIFLLASFFGRSCSRYQNFEFTDSHLGVSCGNLLDSAGARCNVPQRHHLPTGVQFLANACLQSLFLGILPMLAHLFS